MNSFFALISRMRYIGRWGLMRSSIPENVQEHSHMVAVIAHALGVIRREVFGRECDPNALAAAALFHDAPEIITGDLPTPCQVPQRRPDGGVQGSGARGGRKARLHAAGGAAKRV